MKVRYKKQFDNEWKVSSLYVSVEAIVAKLHPTETLQIRVACEHKDTYVQDGIRSCRTCGDTIEVTSYRD